MRGVFLCDGRPISEGQLNRKLKLPGIPDSLTQKAVEVEKARRRNRVLISGSRKRVDEVVVVERIEHLDLRNKLDGLRQLEHLCEPPIERKVFVIFSERVAIRGRAHGGCRRLRGSRL